MTLSDAKRLKDLEAENEKLEKVTIGINVGQRCTAGCRWPKVAGPQEQCAAAAHMMALHGLCVKRACGLVGMSRSLYRYEA